MLRLNCRWDQRIIDDRLVEETEEGAEWRRNKTCTEKNKNDKDEGQETQMSSSQSKISEKD